MVHAKRVFGAWAEPAAAMASGACPASSGRHRRLGVSSVLPRVRAYFSSAMLDSMTMVLKTALLLVAETRTAIDEVTCTGGLNKTIPRGFDTTNTDIQQTMLSAGSESIGH